VVQFKGREMQHKELGRDLLQKIYQPIEDIAAMESTPKVRLLIMIRCKNSNIVMHVKTEVFK
jgi:translation initiation factor IF-3